MSSWPMGGRGNEVGQARVAPVGVVRRRSEMSEVHLTAWDPVQLLHARVYMLLAWIRDCDPTYALTDMHGYISIECEFAVTPP